MHDGMTASWGRLSDGLRNHDDYAWEDDGGMLATPSKPVVTLELPELSQKRLP